MSYKYYGQETFELGDGHKVVCQSQQTAYGFRHVASLRGGCYTELAKTKACYYNRTWEKYTYQSVVHSAIAAFFGEKETKKYQEYVDDVQSGKAGIFTAVKAISAIGALTLDTDEEKNAWDKRMFAAAGLDFPDDWDSLSEEVKKERLDKVKELC